MPKKSKKETEEVYIPENSPFCVKGTEIISRKKDIVPISPCLDIITGGIPVGSTVLLTGDPKAGKSLTALCIARNAQRLGHPIYYFNIEARLKPRDLLGIHGLDPEKIHIIGSYYKNNKASILSAEDFLEEAEKIIHNCPRSVLIFDSISTLVTRKELSENLDEGGYAPGPALMAKFLKRMSNVIAVNDIISIAVLHYTTNMNPMSRKTKKKSGGRKIVYAADVDLEAKYFKIIKNSNGYPIGQEVVWQTMSTAFLPPGQEITSIIRYGVGIDEVGELINLGTDVGLIKRSGAYYKTTFDDQQAMGKNNFRQLLINDKKLLNKLIAEIKEMIYPS